MATVPGSAGGLRSRVSAGLALALAAALAVSACGGGDTSGGNGGGSGVTTEPVVGAHDLTFDPDRITVPAGEPVTLTFENHDEGVDHSLHLDAPGGPATDVFPGTGERELALRLDAGEFEFRCDVHGQMRGTLVARP